MNNEIKEILNKLAKKSSIYKAQINRGTSFNDDEYEASLLLDCITNLQKENERLKESIGELTNRNVKASVYILENIKGNYFKRYDDEIYKMCDDLLDILQGDDENEK